MCFWVWDVFRKNILYVYPVLQQPPPQPTAPPSPHLPTNRYTDHNANALQWRHNGHDGVSNHQPHDCLLHRLFRRRSMKTSKLRVTGLCGGNSPVTGEFPAQRTSYAENVSIWWRLHGNAPIVSTCSTSDYTKAPHIITSRITIYS